MTATQLPFNANTLCGALHEASSVVTIMKQCLSNLAEALNSRFDAGEDVCQLMSERSDAIDQLLLALWRYHGLNERNYTMIAVGGYGRGQLHPCSDIDILILKPSKEEASEPLQSFLTGLWDLSLQIGHAVRDIEECVALAAEDLTVVTSLMETRLLVGNPEQYQQLLHDTAPDKIWPSQKFYGLKWEEQIIRHKKFADTEYSLEPNIKDGPGGLRDVQILSWIGLRHLGTSDFEKMAESGIVLPQEATKLTQSLNHLQRIRWDLHVLSGREEDRLLFDHQRALAEKYAYTDSDDALAVEQYMQQYYQHSMNISNLNELLMQAFEEAIWDTLSVIVPQPLNERFQIRDLHLEPVKGDQLFMEHPSAILEAFAIMAERPQIIGPTVSCIRGIRKARHLIDQQFRDDPHNKATFVRLMNATHKVSSQLRRMNQQGILARYLPEWAGIVGRMQHDLFHIYTVDAHTIQVVKNMRMLSYDGGMEQYPLASQVINRLPELDLLYTAGLFHDVAKGRGGDHSTLGAIDAINYCHRHGYDEHDTKLVAWLVENHLLMSSTSQRKDISDPDVIREFALTVGNEEYLNYLFVLTVCDINATNPTLWTSWRASLLRQLYNETRRALRRGLEKESQREDWVASTRRMAMELLEQKNYTEEDVFPYWENLGEDYFLRETAADIAWHTEAMINHQDGPLVLIKDTDNRRFEGATQIFIYTPETKNLFAQSTAVLSQLNLSIQDARIYNAPHGYAIDTYTVLDAEGQPLPNDQQQHREVKAALIDHLSHGDEDLRVNRLIPRTLKHFATPTQVHLSEEESQIHTIIEVISPDRPGLLATVADIFQRFNINLKTAKVSTLGERVEDVFFVTDSSDTAISDGTLLNTLADTIKTELDQQNSK